MTALLKVTLHPPLTLIFTHLPLSALHAAFSGKNRPLQTLARRWISVRKAGLDARVCARSPLGPALASGRGLAARGK